MYGRSLLSVCIWIVLAIAVVLQADELSDYTVDAWQTEHGLPQNTVKAITQTRDGYLWLGTFDGLVRFDGHQFTAFTVGNTPELRSGDISCLFETRDGRLWIGTDGEGLFSFFQGKFSQETEARTHKVTGVAQTPDERLIVATTTGSFRVSGKEWVPIDLREADGVPTMYSYVEQNERGDVWLTHRNRLYAVSNESVELRQIFPAIIGALTVENNGAVWCALNDGQLVEIPPDDEPRFSALGEHVFHCLRRTRNGDLWMSTQRGILRLRAEHTLHLTREHGLTSDDIGEFYEDREGNLWVGTNGGGLARLREKLVRVHSQQTGIPSNDCTSVIQDRLGRIWVSAFKGGVSIFENEQWTSLKLPAEGQTRPDIASLLEMRDGTVWLGGHFYPHHRWSGDQLEAVSFYGLDAVRVLFEDRTGGFWIGSRDGGVEHRRGKQTRRFDTSNGLSRNMVTAIAEDSSGVIWVGTSSGLNRLSADGLTVYYRKDGLGADGIYALLADSDGVLWIGTAGGGLTRLQNGRFSTVTTARGLPSDVVGQLVQDDSERLWIGTTVGIVRADKQQLHDVMDGKTRLLNCDLFGKSEGLLAAECNNGFQPSCLKARDGKLWFCTIGGAVVINPKQIPRNLLPPPVAIERLVADDRVFFPDAAGTTELRELKIPAGTARLDVHFAGLSLVAPAKVRFRYLLDGYDSDWIQGGTRVAHYTRVPAGHYQFRVMAANNDGVWNPVPAVLPLRIQPLYWQTTWFRMLAGLGLAGTVSGAFWMRMSHVRRVHALRLRIAQDLHDETGSNLGSIQLLSRRAGKRLKQQEHPGSELEEIHRITAQTAESIRNAVWLIDPDFDSIEQMLKAMETISSRVLSDIACELRWNVTRTDRKLSLEVRSHLFLIFKEILHNIQKHADANKVTVSMSDTGGHLLLEVQDDGVGFDPQSADYGHGIKSLKNRAVQMGGQLQIESGPGLGTRVTLKVKPT